MVQDVVDVEVDVVQSQGTTWCTVGPGRPRKLLQPVEADVGHNNGDGDMANVARKLQEGVKTDVVVAQWR